MSIWTHMSFQEYFCFFWIYVTRRETARSCQFYLQIFQKPQCCFPQWLRQLTFPPTVYKGSLSSTSSPTFVTYGLFDDRYSYRCERMSRCALICISLVISNLEHILTCLSAHVYVFFGKNVHSNFLPIKKMFLMLSCMSCLIHFGY